ncbi:MAG: alpha/beta hydrolase [Bdellovibrionota bacterium]
MRIATGLFLIATILGFARLGLAGDIQCSVGANRLPPTPRLDDLMKVADTALAGNYPGCPSPWKCGTFSFSTKVKSGALGKTQKTVQSHIRTGYIDAYSGVSFKGNILYFEGLGDSMLNHRPLFESLTKAGFRVIAFDYMGQGGSTGNMNDTRIEDILRIGEIAWQRDARDTIHFPKRTILGWSTGGLAAYVAAFRSAADQVILIAPGIAPNWFVGEQHPLKLKFDVITLATLTTRKASSAIPDPHLDPIKPESPTDAMDFALDLQKTAYEARQSKIPRDIRGMVLLSGTMDTYVDTNKTRQVLSKNARQFRINQYDGALHEVDNEVSEISDRVKRDILNFLQ